MHFYEIYFSPTGGTKKAADALSSAWEKDVTVIDLILHPEKLAETTFTKDDICLIAVPSYGGRVPTPAIENLKSIRGSGASAILLAVFGNRHIDDTLIELSDTLTANEFRVIAGAEAVAEHSLARKVAAGRPNNDDLAELNAFSEKIKKAYDEGNIPEKIDIPGSHEYRNFKGVPFKPITTDQCNNCGECANECPVSAIPKDNPRITNNDLCISCMHCIAICPKHARKLSDEMAAMAEGKMMKACSGWKENKLYLK